MSGNLMKVASHLKTINLPSDSPIGQRVSVNIGIIHGLQWRAFYTIQNTAKGQIGLKCLEKSLSPWQFLANVEATFKGDRIESKTMEKEVLFSEKMTEMEMEPVEEGRKYEKIELKITRKQAVGVHQDTFVNFSEKNKWLDVLIRDADSTLKVYANSGVLALSSRVLREKFENGEGDLEIVVPKEWFNGLTQLLNFLHPPYVCREETLEKDTVAAMTIAQEWEMGAALKAWEDVLSKNRRYDMDGHAKNLRFADKFKFRKLLEDVIYDLCPEDIYTLVEENSFSNWVRAAMFNCLMLEAEDYNDSASDEDHENDNHVFRNILDVLMFA